MILVGLLYELIFFQSVVIPEVISLHFKDTVRDVVFEDVNGDSYKDILFLAIESESFQKKIMVYFYQQFSPSFSTDKSFTLKVAKPFSIMFLARESGKKSNVVLCSSDELTIFCWNGNSFEEVREIAVNSIFPENAREPIIYKDLAYDLDRDGTDEWFIPTPKGVKIFKCGEIISDVHFKVIHETLIGNNVNLLYQFPLIFPIKDREKTPQPVAFLGDMELVIASGEEWKNIQKFTFDRKDLEQWDFSYRIGDINGDFFPDILVTESQGTLNLKTDVTVYISQGPFCYSKQHNFKYTLKGSVCIPVLKDVNKDNKEDLILFGIPLGLTNFINFFLRGKLSVESKVFLARTEGLSAEPDYKTTLTMDAPEGRDQVAYALDDFSGDGILDIAFGQGRKVIAVNCGSIEGFLKTRTWIKLDLPGFGIIRTGKINSNEKADMVIFRPTGEFKKQVDIILF